VALTEEFDKHMIFVSPLGTKMQTVGICKALGGKSHNSNRLRSQVVYATPVLYNEEYYTTSYESNPIQVAYRIVEGDWQPIEIAALPESESGQQTLFGDG